MLAFAGRRLLRKHGGASGFIVLWHTDPMSSINYYAPLQALAATIKRASPGREEARARGLPFDGAVRSWAVGV